MKKLKKRINSKKNKSSLRTENSEKTKIENFLALNSNLSYNETFSPQKSPTNMRTSSFRKQSVKD